MPNSENVIFLAKMMNIDLDCIHTKDSNNIDVIDSNNIDVIDSNNIDVIDSNNIDKIKDKILDHLLINIKYFPNSKYYITNLSDVALLYNTCDLELLSDDLIINIQSYMCTYGSLKISETNKRINKLLNTNYIWDYLIRRDFILFKYQLEELYNEFSDYKSLYKHLYEKNKIITYLLHKYSGCPITSTSLDMVHKYIGYKPKLLDIIFDIHNDYNGINLVVSPYDIILVFEFLKTVLDSYSYLESLLEIDKNTYLNYLSSDNIDDYKYFKKMQKGREDDIRSFKRLINNFVPFTPDNFDLLLELFGENSYDIQDIMSSYLSSGCIIYFYVCNHNKDNIVTSSIHSVNFDKIDVLCQCFSYLDQILRGDNICKTIDPIIINIYNTYRDDFYLFHNNLISNFTLDIL